MSEGDGGVPTTAAFTRGCRARASLPVVRSTNQTRDRSLGVLYLQYGEETRQVAMPNVLTGPDTLRALFVGAFPQQLTMKMLESPSVAIYVKDNTRNVYYDLQDVRNVTPQCCLKVYHRDPAHAFNRHARPCSAEGRPQITKEALYGVHSPAHSLQSAGRSTLHGLQGSMSPPTVRSMPSSPSRIPFGGPRGSTGSVGTGSATLPRSLQQDSGRTAVPCPSNSSAILERRDVKPDEDLAPGRSMAVVVRRGSAGGDGGAVYHEPFSPSLQEGSGRFSFASSQGSAVPSMASDVVDAGGRGGIQGLQQYRVSIKPLGAYGETQSLHRQRNRKYGESQLPPLANQTPPPSPHRLNEVRRSDSQVGGGLCGQVNPERMSPIRRSLRRESNGAMVEVVGRSRGSVTSVSYTDLPPGHPDRLSQSPVTPNDPQTSERMKAMEKQIASLTGLVQHALAIAPNTSAIRDLLSETDARILVNHVPGASPVPEPQHPELTADMCSSTPLAIQAPPLDPGMQQSLSTAKSSTMELRVQLNQLREQQVANQESVCVMMQHAERELIGLLSNGRGHRAAMDEKRLNYLAMQDSVLSQLRELEDYVDHLKRSSASSCSSSRKQLSITLSDVEEGAVNLRRIGEALAGLKGEFPELQVKMRTVLKVEVEAVRFLKEEPLKMDSILKRVKALTEALSSLRRSVTECHPHSTDSVSPRPAMVEGLEALNPDPRPQWSSMGPQDSPRPQPRSSSRLPGTGEGGQVQATPPSPVVAQRIRSSAAPVTSATGNLHHPGPPLTHGQDEPAVAKHHSQVSPRSREGSPALQKRSFPWRPDGHAPSVGGVSEAAASEESLTTRGSVTHPAHESETTPRAVVETGSAEISSSNSQLTTSLTCSTNPASSPHPPSSPHPTSSTHPISSTHPTISSNADFEHILQETQASLMRTIPVLELTDTRADPSVSAPEDTALPGTEVGQSAPDPTKNQSQQPVSKKPVMVPTMDEIDAPQIRSPVPAEGALPCPSSTKPSSPLSSTTTTTSSSLAPLSADLPQPTLPRPAMEKPRRTSLEREKKESADKAGKSPPPPPPRRFYPAFPGLTTGRSGEVIFTTRKDPIGAQVEDEEELVVPQPKPSRQQPPEVKPKPPNPHANLTSAPALGPATASDSAPVSALEETEEEEEEEDEDDKFMKELQVFQKCTMREVGTRCVLDLSCSDPMTREIDPKIELWKDNPLFDKGDQDTESPSLTPRVMYYVTGQLSNKDASLGEKYEARDGTALPSAQVDNQTAPDLTHHQQVANQNAPDLTHHPQVASENPPDLTHHPKVTNPNPSELTHHSKVTNSNSPALTHLPKVANHKPPNQSHHCPELLTQFQLLHPPPDTGAFVFSGQNNCPKTEVTKARDNVKGPHQSNDLREMAKQLPAMKTNIAEKEESPAATETTHIVNGQVESIVTSSKLPPRVKGGSSGQQGVVPVLISSPPLNGIMENQDSQSQQNKEQPEVVSKKSCDRDHQSLYTDEGSSLSRDLSDEEGPRPPPPPTDNLAFRISKSRPQSLSKKQANATTSLEPHTDLVGNGGNGYQQGEPLEDFDMKPIMFIFDEPLDIQSAYKRLSTIFETEEELERLLASDCIVEDNESERSFTSVETVTDKTSELGDIPSPEKTLGDTLQPLNPGLEERCETESPSKKTETKKKFKFKFPKNKLSAISQAIRSGSKAGKKTIQVVVYEEEETDHGKVTEVRRSEVNRKSIQSDMTINQQNKNNMPLSTKVTSNSNSRSKVAPATTLKTTFPSPPPTCPIVKATYPSPPPSATTVETMSPSSPPPAMTLKVSPPSPSLAATTVKVTSPSPLPSATTVKATSPSLPLPATTLKATSPSPPPTATTVETTTPTTPPPAWSTTPRSPLSPLSASHSGRTKQLYKNANDSIDSLEETIKQLEVTVGNMSLYPSLPKLPASSTTSLTSPKLIFPSDQPASLLSTPASPLSTPASPLSTPTSPLSNPASPLSTPTSPLSNPASPLSTPTSPLSNPASPLSTPTSPLSNPASPLSTPPSTFSTQTVRSQSRTGSTREREFSPSKRPSSQTAKGLKPPQSKRAKSQQQELKQTPATPTRKQNASGSASSGRTSLSKSRHFPGPTDKAVKGQTLPESQRHFQQPRLLTIPR